MYAHTEAQRGYGATFSTLRSDRSTEYDLIARITARMTQADPDTPVGFRDLVTAMSDNRKLWTRLATDVADSRNALPQALRAQIFYLAEFVTHHSSLVLRKEATKDALIEINKTIMRGLAGDKGEAK